MSDLPIEYYRLKAIALAVENGLPDQADWFVRPVEHGAHEAEQHAAPDCGEAATPRSPAIAHGLRRQEEPLPAAPAPATEPPPAPAAAPAAPKRSGALFDAARTDLVRQQVHAARDIGNKPNWNSIAAAVNRLDGPTITPAQAQKFWQNLQYREASDAKRAAA